jgi:hypothetical protein
VSRLRWTGPRDADLTEGQTLLVHPVPPERWPYGPPEEHQAGCNLHRDGLFCDCVASSNEDDEPDADSA